MIPANAWLLTLPVDFCRYRALSRFPGRNSKTQTSSTLNHPFHPLSFLVSLLVIVRRDAETVAKQRCGRGLAVR